MKKAEKAKTRIWFFYVFLLVGVLLLLARLFELQIIFGAKNRAIAEGNRIQRVVNPAPRGIIYDRKKRPLVRNVPVYRLKVPEAQGNKKTREYRVISRKEALEIEAQGGEKANNLRVDIGRDYLYGEVLAHVLGYLGEASKEEVEGGKRRMGDLLGRTGIEEAYDEILRGKEGGELFEVDARGNKIREIGRVEPIPGEDLYLSIDGELSKAAFEALEGRAGAVVATEAKTGRVLVLVSSPSFDPNLFVKLQDEVGAGLQARIEKVLNDPARPMFNRAIAGVYPPGSTFKIVTAVAGVEEGRVDEKTFYEDRGQIRAGEYVYKNWYFSQYGKTEGRIDLVRAIKRSTDTFFYKVGEWVGAKRLAEWARAFGLGRKTGIDIFGEAKGLVPDPEWKEKTKGERWFLGNTYHFAIGQADLLATPLQINMMTSIIANEGKLCRPRIAIRSGDRNLLLQKNGDGECQDLGLKKRTLELVKKGMEEACLPGGTAFPFFRFKPRVACKTGTAEFGDPRGRTHAWLTAFAPVDDPEIVVTALVEGGGEGAYVAAPIVKKVMERWFK